MKPASTRLAAKFAESVAHGLILFLAAGTFHYWQAWVFLVVYNLAGWIPSIYLMRTNPDAFERRMRGPTAETRIAQRILIVGWLLSVPAAFVISGLDHRFGWSQVPTAICLAGDVLVAVGLILVTVVAVQNSYAAANVQVEGGQKIVSTGLYGMVRHPMYTGSMIMMIGIPLALGSYWGLLTVLLAAISLALRIRDEEKMLQEELEGYRDYTQKVRYRLVPCVW
ncbi:methyltransferase family protein [Mycobacterium sp. NPDC051804]|uniref:methyltransferase family protein n=1 Tax=Mycobacterium sp. NPDC051804 TaxID=3364295 RepID=UPI0037B58A66